MAPFMASTDSRPDGHVPVQAAVAEPSGFGFWLACFARVIVDWYDFGFGGSFEIKEGAEARGCFRGFVVPSWGDETVMMARAV